MSHQQLIKPLANKGIAITRPVDQAQKLNTLISVQGGIPISFPLIEITALNDYTAFNQSIAPLNQCDWAIFISSNAVQNAMPRVVEKFGSIGQLPQLRFAAIGPVTATELMSFGVNKVHTPVGQFDSESLLALPEMQAVNGQNIMLFRGVGGRELLAEALQKRGAKITFAESYQRINPQSNHLALERLWKNQQLHAIVVTSSEAIRYLLEIAGSANWLKNIMICVNHARVAEPALALGLQVQVATTAGDAAMINLLIEALGKNSSG
ncbi:MAG: uroporphyrinogen-III synthase [Methylophilaceae bacterium]|nr:uroporphyrinogen-III synthase [Methylophilaceae bacterium]